MVCGRCGRGRNPAKPPLLVGHPGRERTIVWILPKCFEDLLGQTRQGRPSWEDIRRYGGTNHHQRQAIPWGGGGALGTLEFVERFMADKASDWSSEVRHLATFAATQPQAAYAAYTHGLTNQ